MHENLVCDRCGQRFNTRQELEKHKQNCTARGAEQKDRPLTRGAGGNTPTE
jgi:hypothetical protein